MAETYMSPPKFDQAEPNVDAESSTKEEKAPETSTTGDSPPLISLDSEEAPAASTNGEAPAEDKDTKAKEPTNGEKEEEEQIDEEKPADPAAGEDGVTASENETIKNALEAPLPAEFTTAELIETRKKDKGYAYACCFTFCCCPLCYESYEYILEYLCCQKKQ